MTLPEHGMGGRRGVGCMLAHTWSGHPNMENGSRPDENHVSSTSSSEGGRGEEKGQEGEGGRGEKKGQEGEGGGGGGGRRGKRARRKVRRDGGTREGQSAHLAAA